MIQPVLEAIRALLDREGASYRQVHHEPTFTSEESARARGEDVKVGGKALVVKTGDDFRLLVVSAALTVDWGLVKKQFQVKKAAHGRPRGAAAADGTGAGFGAAVRPADLAARFVRRSLRLHNPVIAFNAGSLTDSIVLPVEDYLRVAKPTVVPLAGAAASG